VPRSATSARRWAFLPSASDSFTTRSTIASGAQWRADRRERPRRWRRGA
jgi:hypothetical protein